MIYQVYIILFLRRINSLLFFVFWRFFISKDFIKRNEDIRDPKVRVLSEDGQQLGIMSSFEANKLAKSKKLDLVKINPTAVPPVCKIMDYGRFRYKTYKRERENKKNHKNQEIKEISLSMNIDKHDLETKAKNARRLLSNSCKLKIVLKMRGREQAHSAHGIEVLNNFFAINEDVSFIEKNPSVEGRNIIMVLLPKTEKNKIKKESKDVQNEE